MELALEEERTKLASEKAAYPELCIAAVEKFKGSTNFQMAIDVAIASSMAKEVDGEVGRWERPLEVEAKRKLSRASNGLTSTSTK